MQTLAKHLADNLDAEYEAIGGVSFGSTIAAALYPLLPRKPKRLVLAEPLLDHPSFDEEKIAGAVDGTKNIPTEESILAGNPTWIAAEATLRRMSLTQIDPKAIRQLFEVSLNRLTNLMSRLSMTEVCPTLSSLPPMNQPARRSSSSLPIHR